MIPLTICIPTYEMRGLGQIFLSESFDKLARQTFKDFNIVISDHSENDAIKKLCAQYEGKLDIKYYRNETKRGNSSANINNAISKADGALIKILFQDDFLANDTALAKIMEHFDMKDDHWMVTASEHSTDGIHYIRPFYPRYNDKIHLGKNTISSPSVLTIKNDAPLLFDEQLLWLMDVDYYKRCYTTFGKPKILNEINVVNRIGAHQVTNRMVNGFLKLKECIYILKKYYL